MKKIKAYSYILLLASLALLAHSFVPINHNCENRIDNLSLIDNDLIVKNSKCNGTTNSDDQNDCDCNDVEDVNCFISLGYIVDSDEIDIQNDSQYFHPLLLDLYDNIDIFKYNNISLLSYDYFITNSSDLSSGIGLRAPPKYFS